MATQRSERTKYRRYKVTTYGETPASPAMTEFRIVSDSLKQNKKTVESNALDASRQVRDIYKVGEDAGGSLTGELCYLEWDWAFEGLLGASFVPVTLTASDISAATADNSVNSAALAFGSFVAGQFLTLSAVTFTGYNGLWYVVSQTTGKLVLSRGPVTITTNKTNVEMGAVTLKQNYCRAGNTLNAYTIEREFSDAGVFDVYNSMVVESINISVKGQELVPITVNLMGKSSDEDNTATVAGSVVAESSAVPFNSTNNVFKLIEAATVLSNELVTLDLSLKSNARARTALGVTTPIGFAQDTVEAEGKADFYFNDNARRTKVQNHTSTIIVIAFKDAAGNYLVITMQKIYLLDLNSGVGGKKADVLEQYGFKATKDGTYLQTVCVDSLALVP